MIRMAMNLCQFQGVCVDITMLAFLFGIAVGFCKYPATMLVDVDINV